MMEQLGNETAQAMPQAVSWDSFLDAYSAYLREPSPVKAASLVLAGDRLEETDRRFSMRSFRTRLGWADVDPEVRQ